MLTVVETDYYIKESSECLDEKAREKIIDHLSVYPEEGDIIEGTGGVRKIRWSINNKGKSGGVRVIYYYYNENKPLFLLSMYKKGDKGNITKAEKNELKSLVSILKTQLGG